MQFNWLHLTDLHRGMAEQKWMWPNVMEQLAEDLEHLRPQCGPWDLILFTGDLTNRGTETQFLDVDKVLTQIKSLIASGQGGREPVLLAVPGNHDLCRPPDDDEGLGYLKDWSHSRSTQKNLWEKSVSAVGKTIGDAFTNYSAWWADQVAIGKKQPNGIVDYRPGLLPGDFSATIVNASGCRLGVVGLNTAFLQLTGEEYQGKLALHTHQFHAACGGNGPNWVKDHNACLLLTHHAPEWLDSASQQHLNVEITNNGRFALHLCGHRHVPRREESAADGNKAKRLFLGRSLFGLETFGEKQQEKRLHGYAAGRIRLGGTEAGTIVLWPRSDERSGAEPHLDRDPHQGLPRGREATEPQAFDLPRPCQASTRGGPFPAPAPSAEEVKAVPGCAKTINTLLQDKPVSPLRRCLAERLTGVPESDLGQELCDAPPMDALMMFRGAAHACRRGMSDEEWTGALQKAARSIFGWLLGRFVRTLRPTDHLAVEIRVGTEEGAEVLWMTWLGTDDPPRFMVVGDRLTGEHNVLGGARSAEAGWNWKAYVHEAKLGLWQKVLPHVPVPPEFEPRHNAELANALNRDRVSIGEPPHYATLDRSRVHDPLDDPDCLDALRRDIGLKILFIDASEDGLFAIDERELRNTISQCVQTIDGRRP